MLGEHGKVLPYVSIQDGREPVPGWYATELSEPTVPRAREALAMEFWWTRDGERLYLGIDFPHAAVTIQRLHELLGAGFAAA